jgi:hypothetical protein
MKVLSRIFFIFVLRLPSTSEQFRKFSTGSSYPAILDNDVLKAIVPLADPDERATIVRSTVTALGERNRLVQEANNKLNATLQSAVSILRKPNKGYSQDSDQGAAVDENEMGRSLTI